MRFKRLRPVYLDRDKCLYILVLGSLIWAIKVIFWKKKSKNSFWLVSPITQIRASLIFVSNKCNRCNRQLNELRKDFLWNIFIFSIYSFHKNKCNWDSRLAQLLHCFFAFISFASRHYMKQPRRFSFVILTNLVTS